MSGTQHQDTRDLARFGYKQELDRTLGGFSSFAAGFSYISILTGGVQLFYLGFGSAGPSFFWTWPVVFLGQFAVALCFAEMAAHYPLSGGVYQWSKSVGSPEVGWMAGWVYLACSVITLAAVALALQATLPQISPWFQLVGSPSDPTDGAMNAVIWGCLLIVVSTVINSVGVRLMARINNVGVFAELLGVVLLIVFLALRMRRGPAALLDTPSAGTGYGSLGPFLGASLMASYVMYGFDTAGALAEETSDPRRRAPWAILQALAAAGLVGGLLIVFGLLAAVDLSDPELGRLSGGLPMIVKDVLGPRLGRLFLCEIVFAVTVCALAVHAGSVRLTFAMARDNNLPCSRALAKVQADTRTPILPAVVTGALAVGILLVNVNLPHIVETLCSVAIVWANLAYLLVTLPLLVVRLRGWPDSDPGDLDATKTTGSGLFSLGRFGLPINLLAVVWGIAVIVNVSWPRPAIYGSHPWGRHAATISTLTLMGVGAAYFWLSRRQRSGILPEHAADDPLIEPESGVLSHQFS